MLNEEHLLQSTISNVTWWTKNFSTLTLYFIILALDVPKENFWYEDFLYVFRVDILSLIFEILLHLYIFEHWGLNMQYSKATYFLYYSFFVFLLNVL